MSKYKKICVSLDTDTIEKINKLAEIEKVYNRSAVVRKAVDLLYVKIIGGGDDK